MLSSTVPNLTRDAPLRPERQLQMSCFLAGQAWTGEEATGDALLSTLQRLPRAGWVVTTLGARGSVFLQRAQQQQPPAVGEAQPQKICDVLAELWESAESGKELESSAAAEPACTTPNGMQIRCASLHQRVRLLQPAL